MASASFGNRSYASIWQLVRLLAFLAAAAGAIFWAMKMPIGKPLLFTGCGVLAVTCLAWLVLALNTLREMPPVNAGQATAPAGVLLLGIGAAIVIAAVPLWQVFHKTLGPVPLVIGGLAALVGILAVPRNTVTRIPDLRPEGAAAVLLAAAGIVGHQVGWL